MASAPPPAAPWTLERVRSVTPAGALERGEQAAKAGAVESPLVTGGALLATVRTDRRYEVLILLESGLSECSCDEKALLPARYQCEHTAAALVAHVTPGLARSVAGRARRETVVAVATPDGRHLEIRAEALRPDLRTWILQYRPYFRRETNAYLVPAMSEANLLREFTLRGIDFRVVRERAKARAYLAPDHGMHVLRIERPDAEGAERVALETRLAVEELGGRWEPTLLGYIVPEERVRDLEKALGTLGHDVVTEAPGERGAAGGGTWGLRRDRPAPTREMTAPSLAREDRGARVVVIVPTEKGFTLRPEGRAMPASVHTLLKTAGFHEEDETWAGPLEGVALAVSLLQSRGVEIRGPGTTGPLEGLRLHFHLRAPEAPVALRLLGGNDETRSRVYDLCISEADGRPLLAEDPEGVWLLEDAPGFGRVLHRAILDGATPVVNLALRTQPLERIVVVVDQACLPPRLTEFRSHRDPAAAKKPILSSILLKTLEALIPEGWQEDRERGHLFLPSARANYIVGCLRDLGAEVQYRKLAPAKEQFREWPEHLPEDETGARPKPRAPWRGPLEKPIPGLKPETRLDSHQLEGVAFILHHDHTCLLADEMGLGKTLQSIAAAQFLPGRILVVCPASARSVWEREVRQWTSEETVVLNPGADAEEVLGAHPNAKYVVVAYSGLARFGAHLKPDAFDLVILDESHYIKNKRAKRTRAIVDHLLKVPRRLILSGTPVMNSPEEVRSQLFFLHPDEWSDEAWFRRRFVDPYHAGTPEVKEAILRVLREYLMGVMLRREKRHALPDLPDKRFRVHHVPLAGEARRAYDSEEDGFRAYLRANEETALRDDLVTTAGRLERLKQAALVGKLPEVLRFAREHLDRGEKLVLFTKYVEPIRTLARELKDYGVVTLTGATAPQARGENVRAFQEQDRPRVFVGQLVAAGTAITLTRAAHCVFLDLDWNPANHRQAMDRLHRKGQAREVTVHFFLAENTVDDDVADVLEEKARMMDLLLEGREQGSFGLRDERGLQQDVALRVLARARTASPEAAAVEGDGEKGDSEEGEGG
ncbi:MAG TPA: DEAD/DEAH box helicase [Candidatus Thermoplasmatota archaeon]|nr:DEAD/DEAH box helicase [Candidatus Thermoplasmatota archaeon]